MVEELGRKNFGSDLGSFVCVCVCARVYSVYSVPSKCEEGGVKRRERAVNATKERGERWGWGGGAKGLKEGSSATGSRQGRAGRAVQGTTLANERRSQQGAYFL